MPTNSTTAELISNAVDEHDNFAHEMRVGRILRGHFQQTLKLEHNGTYTDPVTGKPRQFDFRWSGLVDTDRVINLAVECKNVDKEAPIVISGCDRSQEEAFHQLMESRAGGAFKIAGQRFHIDSAAACGPKRVVDSYSSIYQPGDFVGKSLLLLKPNKDGSAYAVNRDEEIYNKWAQALTSATDLVKASRRYAAPLKQRHTFALIIPVVVIPDETLWQVRFDVNGKRVGEAAATNECTFFVGREVKLPIQTGDAEDVYVLSHLHFATITGFAHLLLRIFGRDPEDQDWPDRAFDKGVIAAAKEERLPSAI